jgi:Flp pilus assembly protein TadG
MTLTAMTSSLRHRLLRYLRDDSGNAVFESVFMLPLTIWVGLLMVTFWDGYSSMNRLQKASYTTADILSRWQVRTGLTANDANGLQNMMRYLINENDQVPRVRLSSITWVALRNRYEVNWSCSLDRTPLPPLTTTTLQAFKSRLPTAVDGSSQLLVETELDFKLLNRGQALPITFGEFIVVRPRFQAPAFSNPTACN